jgi:hypothetical protein
LHEVTGCTHLLEKPINEEAISLLTDDASEPETSGHFHRQCHPNDHLPSFRPYFIGLNMVVLDLSLFHNRAMDTLAMLSRALLPCSHGSFIQPKGVDNGLRWASVGKQGHHLYYRFFLCA